MPDPTATGARNVRSEQGHVRTVEECLEAEQGKMSRCEQLPKLSMKRATRDVRIG